MNTQLRGLVVGLVVLMGVGTLGATSAAATVKPRTAMLVKLNQVRAKHGLRAVRPSLLLRLAAKRHSDDMVLRDYFAHTTPGGGTVYDRIVKSVSRRHAGARRRDGCPGHGHRGRSW